MGNLGSSRESNEQAGVEPEKMLSGKAEQVFDNRDYEDILSALPLGY